MDREVYINENLQNKWNYLKEHGYNVVALFLQGSQNYNLDIYDNDYKSDIDTKAIVLPSLHDIVSNRKPISTTIVLENDEHIDVKDIRVMKDMWLKENISYIELLYTRYRIIDDNYKDLFNDLFKIRDDIVLFDIRQFLLCIKGMAMEKYKALEHPYPSLIDKIEKFGYDPKQLHHIIRLYDFVIRFLNGYNVENCYIARDKDYLISVKKGMYSLEKARELADYYNKEIKNVVDGYNNSHDIQVHEETCDELGNIVCEMISRNLKKELMIESKIYDYTQKLTKYYKENNELKAENKQLEELCDKYEEEHTTIFKTWLKDIKKLRKTEYLEKENRLLKEQFGMIYKGKKLNLLSIEKYKDKYCFNYKLEKENNNERT